MTSIQYIQFVTVAECKNITKAAKKLMISQPALTNQIKHLESELGTTLLIRYPRSIELTDAGMLFYKTAKKILQIELNARVDIGDLTRVGGTLKIGITFFLPDKDFFELIDLYKNNNPASMISLYEGSKNDILSLLENEIIDLAIVTSTKKFPPGFHIKPLCKNQMFACWSKYSRFVPDLPEGTELPLSALRDIPLSIPRDLRQFIEECFGEEGFAPLITAVSGTRFATLELAKISGGAAFLVLADNSLPVNDMICFPVRSPRVQTSRYLVTYGQDEIPESARRFIQLTEHKNQVALNSVVL